VTQLAAFGLKQRSLGGNGHRLCSVANFKGDIDAHCLRYLYRQALADELLESWDRDRNLVGASRQLGQCVIPSSRAYDIVQTSGPQISCLNGGIGNHSAGGVGNRAGDCAAVSLGKRGQTKSGQKYCTPNQSHSILPVDITDARRVRLGLHPMSDRMACQGKNLDLLNLNRDVLDLNGGLDYGNGVLYLVSSCTLNPF